MDTASRLLMLLDVIEKGSFSKAAAARNIDRSVISKQISRLEEELGVRLLNRTTRSFSLTAAGAEMIKKAEELRLLLTDTIRLAENYHSEPRGILRITSSTIIGRLYLQPLINQFQKRFPEVEIELYIDDNVVDLIAEGYDLAFRVGEPKDSSLIARKLARNRLLLLASPAFIELYGMPTTIDELLEHPAASYISPSWQYNSIFYYNENNALCEKKTRGNYRSNDGELMMEKALSGNAFVLAPACVIKNEIKDGLLIPLLTHIKLKEFDAMYAVYPHRDLPVRTRLFFDAFKAYIGKEKPIWEENIPNFDNLYQGE